MRTSLKPILLGKIPIFTVQEPICRSTRMSFLPLLFQRRCLAHIIAKSYPIRTVIQFSICPSIGSQREGAKINPLCNIFYSAYNGKKSRYTAHQISGRWSLAISLMKLCTGSAIQKPSMSAVSAPLADSATEAAQPQSLSAAALCFISDIQLWTLLWEQNIV